jgi:hypothetical protein
MSAAKAGMVNEITPKRANLYSTPGRDIRLN